MERYRRLFAALEAIFGKGYVSKLMGKQSNVITLPSKEAKKFLNTELNIMEASEGATKKGIQDLETVISDTKRLSTLNDQELLTITNNAERLANKVSPPPVSTAEILSINTKEKISPEGIMQLTKKTTTLEDIEGFAKGGVVESAEREKLAFGSIGSKLSGIISRLRKKTPLTPEPAPTPRDYRLFQSSNNPFYSLQENPNDGINNVYTEFKKGGTVSNGLDYLTGIERRGYANGDYVVQAGIKNYLGKQKTATVPIKWKSGKGDSHPDTELAYITGPEKELLIKLDMHNSMKNGKPNIGPGGIISLNSGGSGDGGDGGSGDGGAGDSSGDSDGGQGDGGQGDGGNGDGGSDGGGSSGDSGAGAAGDSGAAAGPSGSADASDTGDTGSEAGNAAATSAANASVGIGGPTDTGDMGSEAANNAASAAAAASVGMGTLSSYSRPGMVATNIANHMKANPVTSIGLTALGAMMGVPGLGVMNAVNSVYGGGPSSSSTGSGQGEDGSGDGGNIITPTSSFDNALLSPDLLNSYNLAKNRDYRLYQGANNPFYSMQANPSGGINNVYTEFKKGGRVESKKRKDNSKKGLNYLMGY